MTKEMVASFFEVDIRTIERYIASFSDELKSNGYEVWKGKKLKEFLDAYSKHFGTDINIKYAIFTDMIYQSIFKEKSREYREILKLQKKIE